MMDNQRQEMFPSAALTTVDIRAGVGRMDERWNVAHLAGSTPTRQVMVSVAAKY